MSEKKRVSDIELMIDSHQISTMARHHQLHGRRKSQHPSCERVPTRKSLSKKAVASLRCQYLKKKHG